MKILINTFNSRIAGLYLLLITCDTFSQVLFKAASVDAGTASLESWRGFLDFVLAVLLQPALGAALLLLLIAFGCWMLLIAHTELSKAHLISCIAYATVPVCSVFFFGDQLHTREMIGISLITIGAAISSLY